MPFNQAPLLGPLDEGHLGVAVFMTLSGYLFAKLVGDRKVLIIPFVWNRFIRLAPLLAIVLFIVGIEAPDKATYLRLIAGGVILPNWPNGGWSITAEGHFYLLLPVLLFLLRKAAGIAVAIIAFMILVRLCLWYVGFDIQRLAYITIIGRLDQFTLGMAAFYFADRITGRMAFGALAGLWLLYGLFDAAGGYYHLGRPIVWTFWTTIEGVTMGVIIAWYDRNPLRGKWAWPLQKAGQYSYSIYLLHFFFVERAAQFVDQHIMAMPTLVHSPPWAVLFFAVMTAVGHVSWKLIEEPPLRFRRRYLAHVRSALPGAEENRKR